MTMSIDGKVTEDFLTDKAGGPACNIYYDIKEAQNPMDLYVAELQWKAVLQADTILICLNTSQNNTSYR